MASKILYPKTMKSQDFFITEKKTKISGFFILSEGNLYIYKKIKATIFIIIEIMI